MRKHQKQKNRIIKKILLITLTPIIVIYLSLYFMLSEALVRNTLIPRLQNKIDAHIEVEKIDIQYFFIPKITLLDVKIEQNITKNIKNLIAESIEIQPKFSQWITGNLNAFFITVNKPQLELQKTQKSQKQENIISNQQQQLISDLMEENQAATVKIIDAKVVIARNPDIAIEAINMKIELQQNSSQIRGNLQFNKNRIGFKIKITEKQKNKLSIMANIENKNFHLNFEGQSDIAQKNYLKGKIEIQSENLQKIIEIAGLKNNNNSQKIKKLKLTAQITYQENQIQKKQIQENQVDVDDIQLTLGDTKAKAKLTIRSSQSGSGNQNNLLKADINFQKLELNNIMPLLENLEIMPQDNNNNREQNSEKKIPAKTLKINLKITADELILPDNDVIQNLDALVEANFFNRKIQQYEVKIKNAALYKGKLQATLNGRTHNQKLQNTAKISAKNIDIQQLIAKFTHRRIVTGKADITANLELPQKPTRNNIWRKTSGIIQYKIKDGYFSHAKITDFMQAVKNIAKKLGVIEPPGKNIDFFATDGKIILQKENIGLSANINGQILKINLDGKVKRSNGMIDFNNSLEIWAQKKSKKNKNKLKIPFSVTNTIDEPKISIVIGGAPKETETGKVIAKKIYKKFKKIYKKNTKENK